MTVDDEIAGCAEFTATKRNRYQSHTRYTEPVAADVLYGFTVQGTCVSVECINTCACDDTSISVDRTYDGTANIRNDPDGNFDYSIEFGGPTDDSPECSDNTLTNVARRVFRFSQTGTYRITILGGSCGLSFSMYSCTGECMSLALTSTTDGCPGGDGFTQYQTSVTIQDTSLTYFAFFGYSQTCDSCYFPDG